MESKGRRVALAAGLLGMGVLSAAVWTGRGAAEEWWWIWKLGSDRREERCRAAERLAGMKSVRAVPYLIEAIRRDEAEQISDVTLRVSMMSPSDEGITFRSATPIAQALWSVGGSARSEIATASERAWKAGEVRALDIFMKLQDQTSTFIQTMERE